MFHSITILYPQKFNGTAKSLNEDYYGGEKSKELHSAFLCRQHECFSVLVFGLRKRLKPVSQDRLGPYVPSRAKV